MEEKDHINPEDELILMLFPSRSLSSGSSNPLTWTQSGDGQMDQTAQDPGHG